MQNDMANTLKQLIDYSKANPTSDTAVKLQKAITGGAYDQQASDEGIDLSWAGRPKLPPTPPEESFIEKSKRGFTELAKGIAKGELETLQALGRPGLELKKAITGIDDTEATFLPDKTALEAKTPLEKVGKFGEKVVEAVIPATKVAQATKALSFLPRIFSRVAGDIALGGAQGGTGADAATAGAVSTITQLAPYPVKFLGTIYKNLAGFVSGRGTDVIEQILKTPGLAKEGMKGEATQLLKEETKKVIEQTKALRTASSKNYETALKDIEDNFEEVIKDFSVETKDGVNYIKPRKGTAVVQDPAGNKFNLSLKGLKDALTKSLRGFGVEGGTTTGFDFSNASLLPSEQNIIRAVTDKINTWTDFTPTGINRLRQTISGYARPASGSMEKVNSIIYNMSNSVGEYLGERVPQIAEMNKRFSAEQQFIEELSTHLSSIGKIDKHGQIDPTEFKNVSTKIATLFNKNKELAREVLENLPGGQTILGTEAGRQLATDIPLSKASVGGDISSIIQSIIPPRAVGMTTALLGQISKKLEPIVPILQGLEPTARETLINAIRGIIVPSKE